MCIDIQLRREQKKSIPSNNFFLYLINFILFLLISNIRNIMILYHIIFFQIFFFNFFFSNVPNEQGRSFETFHTSFCFSKFFFIRIFLKGLCIEGLGDRIDSPHFLARVPSICWPNIEIASFFL